VNESICFAPPLIVTEQQIDQLISITAESVKAVIGGSAGGGWAVKLINRPPDPHRRGNRVLPVLTPRSSCACTAVTGELASALQRRGPVAVVIGLVVYFRSLRHWGDARDARRRGGRAPAPVPHDEGRRSGAPREIEIWFTKDDGRYYIVSELQTGRTGSATCWPSRGFAGGSGALVRRPGAGARRCDEPCAGARRAGALLARSTAGVTAWWSS
jgi:hypothetical protein